MTLNDIFIGLAHELEAVLAGYILKITGINKTLADVQDAESMDNQSLDSIKQQISDVTKQMTDLQATIAQYKTPLPVTDNTHPGDSMSQLKDDVAALKSN